MKKNWQHGDTRIKRYFVIIPTKAMTSEGKYKWSWMKWITVEQKYCEYYAGRDMMGWNYLWINLRYV